MAVPITADEFLSVKDLEKTVKRLKKEMLAAAKAQEFEKAAELRDKIKRLEVSELAL